MEPGEYDNGEFQKFEGDEIIDLVDAIHELDEDEFDSISEDSLDQYEAWANAEEAAGNKSAVDQFWNRYIAKQHREQNSDDGPSDDDYRYRG